MIPWKEVTILGSSDFFFLTVLSSSFSCNINFIKTVFFFNNYIKNLCYKTIPFSVLII